jgi:dihydrolipoamide dehydrogenase
MKTETCDLLVVGGGPGGYAAAVRAAVKGLRVILAEKGPMGGTCLNRGCLPTKALLEDTLTVDRVRRARFLKGDVKINRERILERKDALVAESVAGVTQTVLDKGVAILRGEASFVGPDRMVLARPGEEPVEIEARHILLATGSRPEVGPGFTVDGQKVLDTDGALALQSIPRSVAVVGAGNRGVEFASIYANLGVRVTLIDRAKRILPREHRWVSGRYRQALGLRRIQVLTQTEAVGAEPAAGGGVRLSLETPKEGPDRLEADQVLLTGARRPAFSGLNLEAAGLVLRDGFLEHGPTLETEQKGIYVVGDAAGGPYLAHKAIAQAMVAADSILGKAASAETLVIPNCVYGDPEVGSVGLKDSEAKKAGYHVRVGEFYFVRNGRAGTMGKDEGLVLTVSDADTGRVLGMHILGPSATELISLGVTAVRNGLTVEDLKQTVLPHMTLSEAVFESAAATDGEAFHQ